MATKIPTVVGLLIAFGTLTTYPLCFAETAVSQTKTPCISVNEMQPPLKPTEEAMAIIKGGKLLTSSKMDLVDKGTLFEPFFMRDAWVLKEVAKTGLLTISAIKETAQKAQNSFLFASLADERAFVQKNMDVLAKHIATLFAPARDFRGIVIPLLDESLKVNTTSQGQVTEPILIKYFNTNSSITTETFFAGNVFTAIDLECLYKECITFYNDLYKSLSDGARTKLNQAIKTMLVTAKKKSK